MARKPDRLANQIEAVQTSRANYNRAYKELMALRPGKTGTSCTPVNCVTGVRSDLLRSDQRPDLSRRYP
jgi:hypothetical protein